MFNRAENNLISFYKENDLKASFRNLNSKNSLLAYHTMRNRFFSERLNLLPYNFNNLNILEFGPESGENSLSFALNGAKLTLVEPNQDSCKRLLSYFKDYNLENKIQNLFTTDMLNFDVKQKFDFIDAEGFVATIKPYDLWFKKSHKLLKKEGLLLISFFEKRGSFFERFINLLPKISLENTNDSKKNHKSFIKSVMKNKFPANNLSRSIDTWYFDHLINPFAQINWQIDSQNLIDYANKFGFSLYSSYPNYKNNNEVTWYKSSQDTKKFLEDTKENIKRNSLSFMFGGNFYFYGPKNKLALFDEIIMKIISRLSDLEKIVSITKVENFINEISELRSFLYIHKDYFLSEAFKNGIVGLNILIEILELAKSNKSDLIIKKLSNNNWFKNFWGSPVHFTVFRKK